MDASVFGHDCTPSSRDLDADDVVALAAQGLNQTLVVATLHTYRLSRDFILQGYAPIQRHAETLSMVWTIVLLCKLARQAILVASRPTGLPKPATDRRSRRIKLAIPMSSWASVHFVFKPKKRGYLLKLGASFQNVKVLLVVDKPRGSSASVRRQVKCYGGISALKISTGIDG
ncbi:uncharacterized protein MAM_02176 [Metarhizium album ARSEF 1941]|uniref:Uncharacterized protein n=1 Tax=Metarhizium album (strain ARSEF 1941) TaxID=1081103 RepID=A0A0B2X3G3_METAS|nr:uncharacterized protein MAM_02176 [Metarhizium album ARSEF 1941]KHO00253.1 hypothetical protein MAM_02176 [Metarhizium album ARSEF 1941]